METTDYENEMPFIHQNDDNVATAPDDTTQTVKNTYKIDPESETALINAFNNYDEVHKYECSVRPWIDLDYAKKPAINLMTQFALYKCMHEKCLYATDNQQNWEIHMAKHLDMFDVLTKHHGAIVKLTRDIQKKFRDCPYCVNEEKANFKVVGHMEEHSRNAFQCAHCFYRTIEMDNMVLHYGMFHEGKSTDILLCNEQVEFEQKDEEQLQANCDQNIMKIKCGQGI